MKKLIFLLMMMLPILVIGQQDTKYQDNTITFTTSGDVIVTDTVMVGTVTHGAVFDSIHGITLKGKTTVWDDLFFPFTTGNSGGNTYPTFQNDSMYWHFVTDTTGASKCIQYFTVQFPHAADTGLITISPHFHYLHKTANGTPTFAVKWRWMNIGESGVQKFTWTKIDQPTGTTDNTHQLVNGTNDITATISRQISSIFTCQVYLYGQTGTGGIDAYQFDIHYAIDSMGSKTEYGK